MRNIETEIQQRIDCNPEILAGKPVIRGTRIPVYVIIDFFWNGVPETEIVEDYPALTVEDVRAALAYYLRQSALEPGLIPVAELSARFPRMNPGADSTKFLRN